MFNNLKCKICEEEISVFEYAEYHGMCTDCYRNPANHQTTKTRKKRRKSRNVEVRIKNQPTEKINGRLRNEVERDNKINVIYSINLKNRTFYLALNSASQISMDDFLPIFGMLLFITHEKELNELDISKDIFNEYECSLKVISDNFYTLFNTSSKTSMLERKFNTGDRIIFDATHGSVKIRLDELNNPVLMSNKNLQLGELLKSCSYIEPTQEFLGKFIKNPSEYTNDPNFQKFIIQVELQGKKKYSVESTDSIDKIEKVEKPPNPMQKIKSKTTVLDLLDKIGCKKCRKILPPESIDILKKKDRVYCPNCGKLIELKFNYKE